MRSYLLSGACAASILLALTPAAKAADIDVGPEPVAGGWYISVFGGWSSPRDQHIYATDPFIVDADIDPDNGFMIGAAIGTHLFTDWLRAELEVSGHWHDVDGYDFQYNSTLEGDEDALFVLGNLWLDLPMDLGPFRPYLGGGIGFGRLDLDINYDPGGYIDDSGWGFAYQLGAGVAFEVSHNIAIDVGYRYKAILDVDLEMDEDWSGGPDTPEFDKDYKSHNILVGLRFGF